MASKAMVAPVALTAAVRSSMNESADELQTCSAPAERSSSTCASRAHDVDERDAVGEAEAVEHLAEVRRRRGVDERGVALATHRADLPEDGQRVDEARRPLDRGDARRQLEALGDGDAAVLGVHRAAEQADGLAEQRLR